MKTMNVKLYGTRTIDEYRCLAVELPDEVNLDLNSSQVVSWLDNLADVKGINWEECCDEGAFVSEAVEDIMGAPDIVVPVDEWSAHVDAGELPAIPASVRVGSHS